MKKALGILFLLIGTWSLIAPQASLGLPQLRWLSRHSFPGEVFAGMVLASIGYYLLGKPPLGEASLTRPPHR